MFDKGAPQIMPAAGHEQQGAESAYVQRDRRLARRMAAMAGGGIASEDGSVEAAGTWEDLYLSPGLEGLIQEDVRMRPFLRCDIVCLCYA